MKISEYIAALEAIRAEHGDLEVFQDAMGPLFAIAPASAPKVSRFAIPTARERSLKQWSPWGGMGPDRKGAIMVMK